MTDKIYFSENKFSLDWYKVKCKDSGINLFLEDKLKDRPDCIPIHRHHFVHGHYWSVATI